ncbi:hypothetical protein [Nocardia sp. NRRL S-836]|uniref:hypothetical protein n=1 Tax=Nocardia sp. NRRL S-836 TaxID=1519492 RepID=UPI0006AFF440|nr:hypothetical protein [Nocardia sp. NRRL S-836]KOV75505.1 hypothetical protein ADL03_44485 [Nocardia sp. NRRL S-836]
MIRNFAVVGPGPATRERLSAALAAAPDLSVYRIGRGADPLPVSATFDPADQAGCRSLLDWFERGAPSGAVLLVDDWALCADMDPGLDQAVEWIAAFGPARGVQTVVTARDWDVLPRRLRRHLHGEATDFLALHGVSADLHDRWQRRDFKTAVGVDAQGWPVYLDISVNGHGYSGTYLGPLAERAQRLQSALLGLMVTHSPEDLNIAFFDMQDNGVFGDLPSAAHATFVLTGRDDEEWFDRFTTGLHGEINRRQLLIHSVGQCRNSGDYRAKRDAGAELDPLPDLLICVDSAELLLPRGYQQVLESLVRVGRLLGIRMLFSGDTFPSQLAVRIPGWPHATPAHDLADVAGTLPRALADGPPAHEIVLPPLHHDGTDTTLDMLPQGAIGILDRPFEQRRDVLHPMFTQELRHGAIVGKPGTGKTTTLQTLATVLGDLSDYQLLDGPGEPLDPSRHIVVTARSWDEVPPFIRDSLAFGIEFRLDDPATSLVDARAAGRVPDRPGFGLSVPHRLPVRIALP